MSKLSLGQADGKGEKYRMELLTEAYPERGKLRCRVLSASCTAVNDSEVTDGAFAYRIYTDDDGDLVMEIPDTETDWECVSSNEEAVRMIGLLFEDDCVRALFSAGEKPGTSEISLKSLLSGRELTAVITLGEDGKLLASQNAAETFAPAKTPEPALPTPEPDQTFEPQEPGATTPPGMTDVTVPPDPSLATPAPAVTDTPAPTEEPALTEEPVGTEAPAETQNP